MGRALFLTAAFSVAAVVSADHHQCVHDQLHQNLEKHEGYQRRLHEEFSENNYDLQRDSHGRLLQSTFAPIRIKLDTSRLFPENDGIYACVNTSMRYQPTLGRTGAVSEQVLCTEADVVTQEKREYLINTLLPAAINWMQSALSVRRVQGNLRLTNPMQDSFCCAPSAGYCYAFVCCNRHFPVEYRTTGIADSDYLLIVTARPTAGNVLAWATECQADQFGRPLCGHANIAPARMSTSASDLSAQVGVVTHEVMHALGFSRNKFSQFREPVNLTRLAFTNVMSVTYDNNLLKTVSRIISPSVVNFLKVHWNCDSWSAIGGELEDGGGSGTAGSHWEKRVFMNEFMNPTSEPVMIRSGLTLSLLQDSGWYQVDMSVADRYSWGAGQGCNFARLKCNDGWSSAYFCRTVNEAGCTADMRFQGTCNLNVNPYLSYPAQFQYFAGQAGAGGNDQFADYCPYFQLQSTRDCSNPQSVAYFFYGERPGSGARCFRGTYQLAAVQSPPEMHGGCLQTGCNRLTNLLEVTLMSTPNSVVITCPQAGGTLDVSQFASGRFTGTLICPPASQFCTGRPCDIQDCSGKGRCNPDDGSCTCDAGYYGRPEPGRPANKVYSCQLRRCPGYNATSGVECSGNGQCDAQLGICTDGVITNAPGCFPGWRGDSCNARGCPSRNGQFCSGQGFCEVDGRCTCQAGYIGSACSLTDCPAASFFNTTTNRTTTQRCSGDNGVCNLDAGVCECVDGRDGGGSSFFFQGSACGTRRTGARPYLALNYTGEVDEVTNVTGASYFTQLTHKVYQYFSFNVPSIQYTIILSLRLLDVAQSDWVYLTANYEGDGRPSATAAAFTGVTSADEFSTVITLSPPTSSANSGSGAFSRTGRVLVAVVYTGGNAGSTVRAIANLERDGCAVLKCQHGTCRNGRCVCDTSTVAGSSLVTGWSGPLCENPDCPGTPDCNGGKRGACVVPPAAFNAAGVAVRGNYPACQCKGIFSGASCAEYSSLTQAGTVAVGTRDAGWSSTNTWLGLLSPGINVVPNDDRTAFFVKNDGTGARVLNSTFTGRLEAGGSINLFVLDQGRVLQTSTFGMRGTLGLYYRLDASSAARSDPMLLGDSDAPPTLTSYRDFQESAWRSGSKVQEISTVLNPSASPDGDFYVVSVFNGRYAQDAMPFSVYVELSTGCPQTLRGCSGHGACLYTCACDQGWEGIRCETYVPTLQPWVPGQVIEPSPSPSPSSSYSPAPVNVTTTGNGTAVNGTSTQEPGGTGGAGINATGTGAGTNATGTGNATRLLYAQVAAPAAAAVALVNPATPQQPLSLFARLLQGNSDTLDPFATVVPVAGATYGRVDTEFIAPGAFTVYIMEIADSSMEVRVDMASTSVGRASEPMLKVAWSSRRGNNDVVTSSFAVYDYDSVKLGNTTQTVVLRRTNPQLQRYVYVSVGNGPLARSSFMSAVLASQFISPVSGACDPARTDCNKKVCYGRGQYRTVAAGTGACTCDAGWNADTYCGSPSFRSLNDIAAAAQTVSFLCSLCKETQAMERDAVLIYKIPQPLARGSGLRVTMTPLATNFTVTSSGDGGFGASNATVTQVVGFGVPSLLVSTKLPRSLVDFEAVVSPSGISVAGTSASRRLSGIITSTNASTGAVTLTILEASPTGSYWVAMYANTPGRFALDAFRSRLPVEQTAFSFAALEGLDRWLIGTTAGLVVVGVGASLCFLTCCSCLMQCFCGRMKAIGKVREMMEKIEDERHKEYLEEQARKKARREALQKLKHSQRSLASKPALLAALQQGEMQQSITGDPLKPVPKFVLPGQDLVMGMAMARQKPLSAAPPSRPRPKTSGPSLLVAAMSSNSEVATNVDAASAQAGAHISASMGGPAVPAGAYPGMPTGHSAAPGGHGFMGANPLLARNDLQGALLAAAAAPTASIAMARPGNAQVAAPAVVLRSAAGQVPPAGPKAPAGPKLPPGTKGSMQTQNPLAHGGSGV